MVISRDVLIDEKNVFKGPSNEENHVLIFPESNFSEDVSDGSSTHDVETSNTSSEPGFELLTQDLQSTEINTDENAGDGPPSEGEQISEGEHIPEG